MRVVDKHPGGRPRKFNDAEELKKLIMEYFDSITIDVPLTHSELDYIETLEDGKKKEHYKQVPTLNNLGKQVIEKRYFKHPTVSGLARYLGVHRATLNNYEGLNEEFFDTIKSGKILIEEYLETNLYEKNVVGTLFNLKNNFGWKDKQEIDLAVKELPKIIIKKSEKKK